MLPITQTPAQVGSPVRRRKWEQDTGAWALTSLQGAAEQLQIEFKLVDLKQLIAPKERFTDINAYVLSVIKQCTDRGVSPQSVATLRATDFGLMSSPKQ
jgi:hypothetical protein